MIRLSFAVSALLTAACLTAPAGAAQNLIANGDFETGDFAGWNVHGDVGNYTGVRPSEAIAGTFSSYFGEFTSSGVDQTIATTIGGTYHLSFLLTTTGGTPNAYSVSFGEQILSSGTDVEGFDNYVQPFSFDIIATSTQSTLSFDFTHVPGFYYLDNVRLAAVPETASWAMMLVGFGGIGGLMRNRRKGALRFG